MTLLLNIRCWEKELDIYHRHYMLPLWRRVILLLRICHTKEESEFYHLIDCILRLHNKGQFHFSELLTKKFNNLGHIQIEIGETGLG